MTMVGENVTNSNGAIRDVSHALVEGVARAGNGFSQPIGDNEEMSSKVVRMLKGAMFPHITDYSLEVKYKNSEANKEENDFEVIEKVLDGQVISVPEVRIPASSVTLNEKPEKPILLFNPSMDVETAMKTADKSAGDAQSHLPPLDPPKLLQSPFNIPPLFPFNRTTVYLLLSPDTVQQTPESVILRGTSTQGPLELEIPDTVLSKPGETVHQLAAKKLVGELEEGRGWIFHAKTPEGTLLEDKYDGRFSDMVQWEGVRLGVQYQVGGKWCSFVAVEGDEGDEKPAPEEHEEIETIDVEGDEMDQFDTAKLRSCKTMAISSPIFAGGMLACKSRSASTRNMAAHERRSHAVGYGAQWVSPQASASPSMHSSVLAVADGLQGAPSFQPAGSAPAPMCASMFGGNAARRHAPLYYRSRLSPDMSAAGRHRAAADCESESADESAEFAAAGGPSPSGQFGFGPSGLLGRNSGSGNLFGGGLFGSSSKPPPPHAPPAATPVRMSPKDRMPLLVEMQKFEGYWEWNSKLFTVMGWKEDDMTAAWKANETCAKALVASSGKNMAATALVVAWMRTALADKNDVWELLVDKAVSWLDGALSNAGAGLPDAETLVGIAGSVVSGK